MQLKKKRGFSLIELAVVLFIVSLLLGGLILTLSAREDQQSRAETQRRLDSASDALIAFALVNRRLPCPAAPGTTGDESPAGGGTCTNYFDGFLPGRTIGFAPVDAQGYAIDAWSNRIRYAVARSLVTSTCAAGPPHFTSANNLKANGVGCRPNDLVICQSSVGINPGGSPPSCGTAQSVTNKETVAFVLLSTGKNGSGGAAIGPDEVANTDGDAVFVSREQGTIDTATGVYDDMLLWMPAGVFYSKLIAGGVLP